MGNCLKCFQTSTTNDQVNSLSSTTNQINVSLSAGHHQNTDTRGGGFKIDRGNVLKGDRPGETDELLAVSPINSINLKRQNLDTKQRNSFKKSIPFLNGNTASMGDIITTVKEPIQVSDNTLNLLFEEYKDPDEDEILAEGIERLCKDLGYQPDDFAILVLAWRLDASQMCRFTKSEFIGGLHKMTADTIETIRLRLEQTIEKLKTDSDMFKQLYRFTFRFGLEESNRILSLDMAIILWRLVFTVNEPQLLQRWLYFLEQHPNIRGIPKDTWNMFLNFSEQCDISNLHLYDDTEAWPSLFDDFVDYEKTNLKLNKNNLNNNDNDNNNHEKGNSDTSDIL
ncbi:DCN1-like protein 3 [Condylostylus longicornis]|uniref:DCN1-like protein 3 n=1 Tax=Condylostylus longicornis TaxID=2530218 RepID=UPI00244D9F36|nr:DCN1-like protein 3 [Condylostylus longicornis]